MIVLAHGVTLTPRETDVLLLLVQGVTSDREIATRLIIAEQTAHWYVQAIMTKLEVRNRAQVVAYAALNGLIPDGLTWQPIGSIAGAA